MRSRILSLMIVALFGLPFQNALSSTRDSAPGRETTLSGKQQALSGKYEQLEAVLLRMAELNATTNPRRAALLKKVIGESKDKLMVLRFEELIAILRKNRYSQAIGAQTGIEKDLHELLKLLESENRENEINREKEKIQEYLQAIDNLILQQKSLKGRTDESENADALSQEQNALEHKAGELSRSMSELESIGPASEDSRKSEGSENSEDDADDGTENDARQNNGQQSDGTESDVPQNGAESPERENSENENLSPTQKAMQQAQGRMKRAREQLEKAERQGALEDQEEAIAELQRARAELQRMLRQLREEELMQMLQQLDSRLRKMLQMEKAIRTQTEYLQNQQGALSTGMNPEGVSSRQIAILASRLGLDQGKVLQDAEAALLLLREDGTAKAMSESLEQTRFDMLDVLQRLNGADLGSGTIRIEETIIESLQEMIDAVESAKEDSQRRDEQNKQDSDRQGGSPEEQRLIDLLSELRMIRTMQRRINERTSRYERQLVGENVDLADLEKKVDELTRQQIRIQTILRDIALEKNQ